MPPALSAVLPRRRTPWAAIVFVTLIALGLVVAVTGLLRADTVSALGGTTALLLLGVFTVVNVACLVLRRSDHVAHEHFRAPVVVPVLGAATCAFLVGPWTGRDPAQYRIAGVLLGLGVALWVLTWLWNRLVRGRTATFVDVDDRGR